MDLGPLAGMGGGLPWVRAAGPEAELARLDAAHRQRRVQGQQRAEDAAGVGPADGEEHQAGERDANGRLPWENPPPARPADPPLPDTAADSGRLLDLSG